MIYNILSKLCIYYIFVSWLYLLWCRYMIRQLHKHIASWASQQANHTVQANSAIGTLEIGRTTVDIGRGFFHPVYCSVVYELLWADTYT